MGTEKLGLRVPGVLAMLLMVKVEISFFLKGSRQTFCLVRFFFLKATLLLDSRIYMYFPA